MRPSREHASAAAFRIALEDRLKKLAQRESLDFQRVRRQVAFDRLLCRLFARADASWLLKGGYAMELRLRTARATRDIDLALKQLAISSADWAANAATVLEALREAGRLDLQDFFTFVFGDAIRDLDAAPYPKPQARPGAPIPHAHPLPPSSAGARQQGGASGVCETGVDQNSVVAGI